MADAIKIDYSSLVKGGEVIKALNKEMLDKVDSVLDANAEAIALEAKERAPKNFGNLANSISADISKPLEKRITANSNYAAFMEFGTGKYAAAEVGKLSAMWQQYAATFKGQKGGSAEEMYNNILKWVHYKRIKWESAAKFKSGKKQGQSKMLTDEQTAWFIYHYILFNGVRAHPFMVPAYEHYRPKIIEQVEAVLKNL